MRAAYQRTYPLARAKASAFTAPLAGMDEGVTRRALRLKSPAVLRQVVLVCVLVIEIILPEVGSLSSLTDWVTLCKGIK